MEAGEGVPELCTARAGGHAAEAGAAPVDGAVGADEAGRRLRLGQRDVPGGGQLLAGRHHYHVFAARSRYPLGA